MRISDWSSDVCSSDLRRRGRPRRPRPRNPARLPPCWRLGRAQLSRAPRGAAARRMIETERLVMRSWRDEDIAPFQRICSDPEVMATLGPPLDLDRSEEHKSELQSLMRNSYAVLSLKKKKNKTIFTSQH